MLAHAQDRRCGAVEPRIARIFRILEMLACRHPPSLDGNVGGSTSSDRAM
jgi:hypothetical protein